MKKLFIAVLVLAAVWELYNAEDSITLGPGVMAPEAPMQIMLEPMVIERTSDYTISELASFELTAKVLAKEDYRMDREADLSPTDLTLGYFQLIAGGGMPSRPFGNGSDDVSMLIMK